MKVTRREKITARQLDEDEQLITSERVVAANAGDYELTFEYPNPDPESDRPLIHTAHYDPDSFALEFDESDDDKADDKADKPAKKAASKGRIK